MNYPIHLPRRHRRRLFFPPGLLALAWLLWLGCGALHHHLAALPHPNVMQVGFPGLHGGISACTLPRSALTWPLPVYSSEQQLETFRAWQTFHLTGYAWADYFEARGARQSIEQLNAWDGKKELGVRIIFDKQARYASFVQVLDWLSLYGSSYWIGLLHEPTTIYAYTNLYNPITSIEDSYLMGCQGAYLVTIPSIPPSLSWQQKGINWITALLSPTTYAPLFSSPWRASTLLLLLMALLALRRQLRGLAPA